MKINSATYVQEISVVDPDTKQDVILSVFKHDTSGGMFAIDSSFLDQCFDDDETPMVSDPFNNDALVELEAV